MEAGGEQEKVRVTGVKKRQTRLLVVLITDYYSGGEKEGRWSRRGEDRRSKASERGWMLPEERERRRVSRMREKKEEQKKKIDEKMKGKRNLK
jgi:hypothetical protein